MRPSPSGVSGPALARPASGSGGAGGAGLSAPSRSRLAAGLFRVFSEFEEHAAGLLTELLAQELAAASAAAAGSPSAAHASAAPWASGLSYRSSSSLKPDCVPPLNLDTLKKKEEVKVKGAKQGLIRTNSGISSKSKNSAGSATSSATVTVSDSTEGDGLHDAGTAMSAAPSRLQHVPEAHSVDAAGHLEGAHPLPFLASLDGIQDIQHLLTGSQGSEESNKNVTTAAKVRAFVRSRHFELCSWLVIVASCLCFGAQAEHAAGQGAAADAEPSSGEHVFVALFAAEMALRSWARGGRSLVPRQPLLAAVRHAWSLADFALVMTSGVVFTWILPSSIATSARERITLGAVRSLLVLRSLRLLQLADLAAPSEVPRQALVLLRSLRSSFHVLFLGSFAIVVTSYLFAVVGVWAIGGQLHVLLQEALPLSDEAQELQDLFGRLGTLERFGECLLQSLTLDGLGELARRLSRHIGWAACYLYAYLAVAWLVIGHVVSALLVESSAEAKRFVDEVARRERERSFSRDLPKLASVDDAAPSSPGSHRISVERLVQSLQEEPEMWRRWKALGVKSEELAVLLRALAAPASAASAGEGRAAPTVGLSELFESLGQGKVTPRSIDLLLLRHSVERLEDKLGDGRGCVPFGASAAALVAHRTLEDRPAARTPPRSPPAAALRAVSPILKGASRPPSEAASDCTNTAAAGSHGVFERSGSPTSQPSPLHADDGDGDETCELFPWEDVFKQPESAVPAKQILKQRSSLAVAGDGTNDIPLEPPQSTKHLQFLSGSGCASQP